MCAPVSHLESTSYAGTTTQQYTPNTMEVGTRWGYAATRPAACAHGICGGIPSCAWDRAVTIPSQSRHKCAADVGVSPRRDSQLRLQPQRKANATPLHATIDNGSATVRVIRPRTPQTTHTLIAGILRPTQCRHRCAATITAAAMLRHPATTTTATPHGVILQPHTNPLIN